MTLPNLLRDTNVVVNVVNRSNSLVSQGQSVRLTASINNIIYMCKERAQVAMKITSSISMPAGSPARLVAMCCA